MKNVKRYRFFLVLLCVTIFSEFNFSNVMASDPTEKIVSEEYVMKQREEGKLRYGESEKVTVVDREYKSYEFIPDGQPPGGKSIESGGGIWIIENKGSTIELSASLAWEMVSFSVNVGLYSEKATDDGTMVYIPTGKIRYKVKRKDTYKFERHRVDVYQYNVYQYTYHTTIRSLYSTDYELINMGVASNY